MKTKFALICLFLISLQNCCYAQNVAFTLEEVCRSDSIKKPIPFSDVNQVRELIETFNGDKNLCPERFHNSITELGEVLRDEHLNDACSKRTYQSIRNYHNRFISVYTPEATKEELKTRIDRGLEEIPESLQQFFIVFVQKITGICKQNLINRFNNEVKNLQEVQINDKGFELMHLLNERGSRLTNKDFHKEPKYIDETLVSSIELNDKQKLYLVLNDAQHIVNKVKNVCVGRFKPIYEELFLPVIRLNNLGYWEDYLTHLENKQLHNDKSYRRWYTIIETCEQFNNVELIINQDEIVRSDLIKDSEINEKVEIVNYDEAKNLINKLELNPPKRQIEMPKGIEFEHKPILFGVSLWSTTPKEIKIAINEFRHQNRKLIHQKTSLLTALRHKLISKIEKFKQQWRNRDETASMGRLSNWYHKHHGDLIVGLLFVTLASVLIL